MKITGRYFISRVNATSIVNWTTTVEIQRLHLPTIDTVIPSSTDGIVSLAELATDYLKFVVQGIMVAVVTIVVG